MKAFATSVWITCSDEEFDEGQLPESMQKVSYNLAVPKDLTSFIKAAKASSEDEAVRFCVEITLENQILAGIVPDNMLPSRALVEGTGIVWQWREDQLEAAITAMQETLMRYKEFPHTDD
jgi:hypothetical protein